MISCGCIDYSPLPSSLLCFLTVEQLLYISGEAMGKDKPYPWICGCYGVLET